MLPITASLQPRFLSWGTARKANRDISSPAFSVPSLGSFGQQFIMRNPSEKEHPAPKFVRPDSEVAAEEASARVPTKPSGQDEFDMANLGGVQMRASKTAPTRSALEQASYLTNDTLWNDRERSTPKRK